MKNLISSNKSGLENACGLTHWSDTRQRSRYACIEALVKQSMQILIKIVLLRALRSPSRATVFLTTSIAPVYTPLSDVCNLTLTRSKGCPTRTAQTPPPPPAANERRPERVDLVATTTSLLTSSAEGIEEVGDDDEAGIAAKVSTQQLQEI